MQQEITWRIDRLDHDFDRLPPREAMRLLSELRACSHGGGMHAVAELASWLQRDLAAHGREAPVHAYFGQMRDAVDVAPDAQPRFVELSLAALAAGWAFA